MLIPIISPLETTKKKHNLPIEIPQREKATGKENQFRIMNELYKEDSKKKEEELEIENSRETIAIYWRKKKKYRNIKIILKINQIDA